MQVSVPKISGCYESVVVFHSCMPRCFVLFCMARFLDCSMPGVAVSHRLVQLVATFSKRWQQHGCHSTSCALFRNLPAAAEPVWGCSFTQCFSFDPERTHSHSSDVAQCWRWARWMLVNFPLNAIKKYECLESSWVISRWVSECLWPGDEPAGNFQLGCQSTFHIPSDQQQHPLTRWSSSGLTLARHTGTKQCQGIPLVNDLPFQLYNC